MQSYAIVIKGNEYSEHGFEQLQKSSHRVDNQFETLRFDAITTPSDWANAYWNYPWVGSNLDIATGLLKISYPTAVPSKRISCAESHYNLWVKCLDADENFLIQEHDSIWKRQLSQHFDLQGYSIVGINDPRGATRMSNKYHSETQINPSSFRHSVSRAPLIDQANIPQGIAGNSAYIITPKGAQQMINLVSDYGLWPNDALMCRQLLPQLGQSRTYYTRLLGLPSTTST